MRNLSIFLSSCIICYLIFGTGYEFDIHAMRQFPILQENHGIIGEVGFIIFLCGFVLLTDVLFLSENKEKTDSAITKISKKRSLAIFGIVLGLSLHLIAYSAR